MRYNTYLGILVVSAVTAFWLTPLAGWLAFRVGAIDIPNERKVHRGVMPRLGGLAVYLAFLLSLLAVPFLQNSIAAEFRRFAQLMVPLFLGSLATLLLGIYDDIRGANASKKFLAQIVIASGLWMGGFRIDAMIVPFLGPIDLHYIGLPITVLWIVGVTNAVNLLDGLDGLVAGVTACMALSLAVINIFSQNVLVSLLNLALAGACLGFLPHNHSPARIFLGDSGSLTIGMILSCISIISLFNGEEGSRGASSVLTVPLLLFALPLFDTAQVMYNRWRRNVSIFQADKGHVHHHLLAMGYDHRQAARILYSVAIVTGILAIALSLMDLGSQIFLSILFLVMAIGFLLIWRSRLRDDDDDTDSRKSGDSEMTYRDPAL
ncbi:MAG: undecaprenyl/decaprenyl-phosphate alpha-N-acetylglucosaminyl 1-phosphate transferase [Verrucomicrobia bacterium]|nr:undecaprenyl/decaprenyl-phosphate alpha-N-acetylglucosaminyl 1-phosphate transferase [Verrucomicrobiota bacterium]